MEIYSSQFQRAITTENEGGAIVNERSLLIEGSRFEDCKGKANKQYEHDTPSFLKGWGFLRASLHPKPIGTF